jgi:hypothetical protein
MPIIAVVLMILKIWLLIGLVFGVAFVAVGITRVDTTAQGSSWKLRLILLPGCMVFWPWLGWLWLRGRSAPVECTYHRCAVKPEN